MSEIEKYKYFKTIPRIGECEINEDEIVKNWLEKPNLWFLSQWNEEFRICRQRQINGQCFNFKNTISKKDAESLIDRLSLLKSKSCFASGSTWCLLIRYTIIREYNLRKNNGYNVKLNTKNLCLEKTYTTSLKQANKEKEDR
jgi:hypothetical protein